MNLCFISSGCCRRAAAVANNCLCKFQNKLFIVDFMSSTKLQSFNAICLTGKDTLVSLASSIVPFAVVGAVIILLLVFLLSSFVRECPQQQASSLRFMCNRTHAQLTRLNAIALQWCDDANMFAAIFTSACLCRVIYVHSMLLHVCNCVHNISFRLA